MSLKSDITINAAQFDPAFTPKATQELNENLSKMMANGPKWYEVGAEKYRQMRWNNETPVPRPPVIESGEDIKIPSRDSGREIPCRMFKPENGISKGIFLHIHGGGFVLMSEKYQDTYLKFLADSGNLTVVSAGYRLAPEHPYPAGPEDCVDVAEHLMKEGEQFHGDLLFIGGESAGGHLSLATALELLRRYSEPLPLKGLVLNYGVYDLGYFLPAVQSWGKENRTLILTMEVMEKFTEAFLPNSTIEQRRDPRVSPIFENLNKFRGRLPPSLFTAGTEDPLLDDTTVMSVKWMAAGGEAIVKIYPGAPHGFSLFDQKQLESAADVHQVIKQFMHEKLGS